MKIIIGLAFFLSMTSQSMAYNMQELEGKYRVSSKRLRVENTFSVNRNGFIKLRDKSGALDCQGPSKLDSDIITTTLKCKNTPAGIVPFSFRIDLTQVKDLNRFTANLYISMIGETPWDFERLEN